MSDRNTVGDMRQQCALSPASARLTIVTTDERETSALLEGVELEIVRTYPDTRDGRGQLGNVFKIEVRARRRP